MPAQLQPVAFVIHDHPLEATLEQMPARAVACMPIPGEARVRLIEAAPPVKAPTSRRQDVLDSRPNKA